MDYFSDFQEGKDRRNVNVAYVSDKGNSSNHLSGFNENYKEITVIQLLKIASACAKQKVEFYELAFCEKHGFQYPQWHIIEETKPLCFFNSFSNYPKELFGLTPFLLKSSIWYQVHLHLLESTNEQK